MWFVDSVLFSGGEASVEGNYFHSVRPVGSPRVLHILRPQMLRKSALGLPNVPLPGKENQDVTVGFGQEFIDGFTKRGFKIQVLAQPIPQRSQISRVWLGV